MSELPGRETTVGSKFTAISAGSNHSCAIRSDGSVVCWGENFDGQADAPVGDFTAVSAGSNHSCAIRSDGSVVCWGDNTSGQTDAPGGKFVEIAAGGTHTCGIRADKKASCWGINYQYSRDTPWGEIFEDTLEQPPPDELTSIASSSSQFISDGISKPHAYSLFVRRSEPMELSLVGVIVVTRQSRYRLGHSTLSPPAVPNHVRSDLIERWIVGTITIESAKVDPPSGKVHRSCGRRCLGVCRSEFVVWNPYRSHRILLGVR